MKKTLALSAALLLIPPQAFCLSLGDIFTEVVTQAIQGDTTPEKNTPAAVKTPTQTQASTGNSGESQRVETEQERSLRERAEKDRLEKLANAPLELLAKQANIPKERLFIWEDTGARTNGNLLSRYSYYAKQLILDSVNKFAQGEIDNALIFEEPRKSDYEKQVEYEIRLKKARDEFNETEAVADTNSYRLKMIKKYFGLLVGNPEVKTFRDYFKYDAEAETLTLWLINDGTSSDLIATPVTFPGITPEVGRAFEKLSGRVRAFPCVQPRIGMEWLSNKLTAKFVVFKYRRSCENGNSEEVAAYNTIASLPETHPLKAGVLINHQYPVVFGKETANNFEKTIAAAEQAANRKRMEKDQTKIWYPLHSKIKDEIYECKVIKDNIAAIAMTNGDKAAYDSAVNYKNRYAICFR